MKTLCMDSAHKHLVIVLLEDGEVKASYSSACWKRQSENLFPELIRLMDRLGWSANDIGEVIITDGPGSYTGVRIAMTVAKVFCTTMNVPLYCISTLQLYAGLKEKAFVMLDARSNRAYCGVLDKGVFLQEEGILTLDEIKTVVKNGEYEVLGDSELIGMESGSIDFVEAFRSLLPYARRIENVHTLTPRYLKEQDAYKVVKP